MIEQLTIERLTEYGFTETRIERLQNWDEYECFCHNNNGIFWASNVEHKIYSGKEAASRRNYFRGDYISFPVEDLDLVPEYYELKRSKFIESQRQIAGAIFNEKTAKERFRENEIVITKKAISDNEKYQIMPRLRVKAEKLKHYLIWLNELKEPAETQPEQLTAPVIACFCKVVNESKLIIKGDAESNESYCKRVCEAYNLV